MWIAHSYRLQVDHRRLFGVDAGHLPKGLVLRDSEPGCTNPRPGTIIALKDGTNQWVHVRFDLTMGRGRYRD
jgi:hypothetical protein